MKWSQISDLGVITTILQSLPKLNIKHLENNVDKIVKGRVCQHTFGMQSIS